MRKMEINTTAVLLAMANVGLTTSQMAQKAGISQQTAVRFTSKGGNSSPATFYKVGKALNVEPSSLVIFRD